MDPRVEAMARVLVHYCVGVKPGDWTVIQSSTPLGEPLAEACVREALRAGGNPSVLFGSEDIQNTVLREGNDDQLRFVSPFGTLLTEKADVHIMILAPRNTRTLAGIDASRMALAARAGESQGETRMRRMADGSYRWVIGQYPTAAAAQDAGLSLRAYEDFVYRAGLLFEPDAVAAWQDLHERQQRIVDWLSTKETLRVTGPDTDLTVSIAGRTWINDDGHYNFPGGEVFTGPHEDGTEGTIRFNLPGFYTGQEVTGARLVFKGGRVTDASASTGEEFLTKMLDMDDGARRLGEFAIGTNQGVQQFTRNTLFDEKIGGTLHMALGRSVPMTGGQNESAIHWDMVYDLRPGAEITVDGQPFSREGRVLI